MEEVRVVMDNLFQRKITFDDAVAILKISEDELHNMIGSYEYTPTKEQIHEVNKMIIETIESIENDMYTICDRIKLQDVKAPNAVSESPIMLSPSEDLMKDATDADSMNISNNRFSHDYIW